MYAHLLPVAGSESVMPELRVFLLGSPRVEAGDHLIDITRRQARALLYRLAVSTQPVARAVLCFLIWPEINDVNARRNLSRLVSILHHSLPLPNYLVTSADQISLNANYVWSDTRAFQQLWDSWKAGGAIDQLRRAVNLRRGPFLDGFSLSGSAEFDTWVVTERQYWERLTLEGLEGLIDAEAKEYNYVNAIEFGRRYLTIDELNEDVHRRLIEYYGQIGDRNAAHQQYERCKMVLERDLGVDPLPETQALYQAVRVGQIIQPLRIPASRTPWPPQSLDVPFFGRDPALHALEKASAQSLNKQNQIVLISGEPGIGKTRLMQEFLAKVENQAVVFVGSCHPETSRSPYQPIIEALRSQLSTRELPLVSPPNWLDDISRLLPDLAELQQRVTEAPPSEPGWARTRLFEAIDSLFEWLVGKTSPAILGLDDLQWADLVTLDWLAYKTHHQPNYPFLFIGTYRNEEAGNLVNLIEKLSVQGNLVDLHLQGLDEDDVERLLNHFQDRIAHSEITAGQVRQLSGGNPFFILEMVHALTTPAGDRDATSESDVLPVPGTIKSAVQARLRQLSATAHQIIEGGAVLGHQFDLDTVALTAGRSENETIAALEEVTAHQLLVTKSEFFLFKHEIVREVIYRELSHYRRRLLHRRAGQALEKLKPAAVVALAMHLEAADQPGRAAHYAIEAGREARKVFAPVEARSWFDHALTLLEREVATLRESGPLEENRKARFETLNERSWALRLVGDMEALTRDLEEASQLVEHLHDRQAKARIRQRQAAAHAWFCRYDAALADANEGLHLSQGLGDVLGEALCWREIGLVARATGEYARAEEALRHAFDLLIAPEHASLRVHLLGNLSTLYLYQSNFIQAKETACQALELCDTNELKQDRRLPLGDLGAVASALDDRPFARQCLEESLRIAIQVADSTQEILCLGHLGWLEIKECQTDKALTRLKNALDLAEHINSCAEQSWLYAGMAEAFHLAGRADDARTHARHALDLARKTGNVHDRLLAENTMRKVR